MDPTALIAAIGTAAAGVLAAVAAVITALRRTPKHAHRMLRLTGLLERIRDWLQTVGLWKDLPEDLRRDINRALDQSLDTEDDDHETRRDRD